MDQDMKFGEKVEISNMISIDLIVIYNNKMWDHILLEFGEVSKDFTHLC